MIWSPLSHRSEEHGNESVLSKDSSLLLLTLAAFAPRCTALLSHHFLLSPFFLASSEFVNSGSDWFRERGALREGKSVVISKPSGILCLRIRRASFPRQLMWKCRHCRLGQYVCCHSAHNEFLQRQCTLYVWIHKQAPEYRINSKEQIEVLILAETTTLPA